MRRLVLLAVVALFAVLDGEGPSALTSGQCRFFETNGTTTICHATKSARHPYVLMNVSPKACDAHADHADDFVSTDGSCRASSCLPFGSPCDTTSPCCEGLTCTNGVCSEEPQLLADEPAMSVVPSK